MSEKEKPTIGVQVIKTQRKVEKATGPTAVTDNNINGTEWISPPLPMPIFKEMVEHSTILPQCRTAYKNNIAGFGIGIRYIEDIEETPEMKAEWDRAKEIVDLLCMDKSTKEVFEDVIEARETYGIAYIEIIRNLSGEVVQIEFVKDTPSVIKTNPLEPAVEVDFFYKGVRQPRRRKFCKYKQQRNGKAVYFKEFGDPRVMDIKTGDYSGTEGTDDEEVDAVPIERQANEILEFAIGTAPYGTVRWIGQMLNIDGSRRAENLNNSYFIKGRHTPLAILISGGTLSPGSYETLQAYMNDIEGESGQHAFLLMEVEESDNKAAFEADKKPTVELKPLASILQKDELFQEYLDNSRKKAQSAFLLPDIYTGYTTEFNRATAQTAQEVTEQQVFHKERESLAWIINNKLLNAYQFKHVEVFFKEPDITNPEDLAKILTITEKAGGITPNMAKQVTYKTLGLDGEENYPDEWGEIPFAAYGRSSGARTGAAVSNPLLTEQVEKAIQKASAAHDDDIIPILKDVKALLQKQMEVTD